MIPFHPNFIWASSIRHALNARIETLPRGVFSNSRGWLSVFSITGLSDADHRSKPDELEMLAAEFIARRS
jgi:hypothetical protein